MMKSHFSEKTIVGVPTNFFGFLPKFDFIKKGDFMSILKNLKKQKNSGFILKSGIILLLDKQEQFNKLASLFDLQEDSVCIDGVYVAYMDEYPALQVEPIQNICGEIDNALEAFEHKNLKPIDFDKWYKNINAKIKY